MQTYEDPNFAVLAEVLTTTSPITNQPILSREAIADSEVVLLPAISTQAFNHFRLTTLAQRQTIVQLALRLLLAKKDVLARELTDQVGRPIAYAAKEITTAVARGEYLLKISGDRLKDSEGEPEKGFKRYIRKAPLGPILIIFAWNVGPLMCLSLISLTDLALPLVSLLDIDQFLNTSLTCRQPSHPQAIASNPYHCGAHL